MGNAYCGSCNCTDKTESKNEFKSEIHTDKKPQKFEVTSNFPPINNMIKVF